MDSTYDVGIAGGGFAGMIAAESCAENGGDCILFERSSEVGYPIHTSGGSFIADLRAKNIPEELFHGIKRVEFIAPSEQASFSYDTPKICVIDVRAVQQHLAERAIAAGATINVDSTVVDVKTEDSTSGVSGLVVDGPEGRRTVETKVAIDATGFRSIIAQKAGIHDGFERFGRGIEYDLYAPEYDSTTARLIVGESLIPGGYAWMFPYRDDRIRVGLGSLYPDEDQDLRQSIDKLFEKYSEFRLDRDAQVERHSGVIPSEGSPSKTVDDGVILAGDAANFPFGIVGEGIRMALETGQKAGRVAADAIDEGDTSRSCLEEYERYWQTEYSKSLQVSHAINERLADFDDGNWNKGARILRKLDEDEFYMLLKSDFSKKRIIELVRSHPDLLMPLGKELIKAGIVNRL